MKLPRASVAERLAAEQLRRQQKRRVTNNTRRKKLDGLTARQLVANTPPYVKYNGGFVTPTKIKFDPKKNMYLCETRTNELGQQPRIHKQEITLLSGTDIRDRNAKIMIDCDCEFFCYYCEYALSLYGSAVIRRSNGEPSFTTNPRFVPILCLAKGTLINTDKGLVPIEDVKANDNVLTLDGYKPVTKAWCSGIQQVFMVRLSGGTTLKLTGNHPLLVFNKRSLSFEWKRTDALEPGDTVVRVLNGTHKVKHTKKELVDAQIMGLIISDGYMNGFSNKDERLIDKMSDLLSYYGEKTHSISYNSEDGMYGLRISMPIFRQINSEGLGRNSYEHEVPKWIMTASYEVKRAFIGALYEGDGWVHKEGTAITYGSVSRKLILQLQTLLLSLGIDSRITMNISGVKDSLMWLLRINNVDNLKKFLALIRGYCVKYTTCSYSDKAIQHAKAYHLQTPVTSDQFVPLVLKAKLTIGGYGDDVAMSLTDIADYLCSTIGVKQSKREQEGLLTNMARVLERQGKVFRIKVKGIGKPVKATLIKDFNDNILEIFNYSGNIFRSHYVKHLYAERSCSKYRIRSILGYSPRKSLNLNLVINQLLRTDLIYTDVEFIKPLKKQRKVYDLEVAEAEHFVANGVVVHNCKHGLVVIEKLLKMK